jgi:hypothetical protein
MRAEGSPGIEQERTRIPPIIDLDFTLIADGQRNNEDVLYDMVISRLKNREIDVSRVVLAGFDGGEDPISTIQEPRDLILASTVEQCQLEMKEKTDANIVTTPVLGTIDARTPCIGVFDVDKLLPTDRTPGHHWKLPIYNGWDSGSVNDALLAVFMFRQPERAEPV